MNKTPTFLLALILALQPLFAQHSDTLSSTYEPVNQKTANGQLAELQKKGALTASNLLKVGASIHGVAPHKDNPLIRLSPTAQAVEAEPLTPAAVNSTFDFTATARAQVDANLPGNIGPKSKSNSPADHAAVAVWLEGINSVAQSNKSESDLLVAIGLIDSMMRTATKNSKGFLTWIGGPSISEDARELAIYKVAAEIARTAGLIATNQAWKVKYGTLITSYDNFLKDMVLGGYNGTQLPWTREGTWNQKAGYFGAMLAGLYTATGDTLYRTLAQSLAANFTPRLRQNGPGWTWDAPGAPPLTSQAGATVKMMVYMYEAGLAFTQSDISRMAATLTDVLWNKSVQTPSFADRLNGTYDSGAQAGQNGIVSSEWSLLARHDQNAHDRLTAYYLYLAANSTNSATIPNRLNGGAATLAGNLTRFLIEGRLLRQNAITGLRNAVSGASNGLAVGAYMTLTLREQPQEGMEIFVDGKRALIVSITGNEVKVMIPKGITADRPVTVSLEIAGKTIGSLSTVIKPVDPAIYPNGVLNQDNSLNGSNEEGKNPAIAGSVMQVYATGLSVPKGWQVFGVIHDRENILPEYSGDTTFEGVQQVNLKIPDDLPTMESEVKVCAREPGDNGRVICSPPSVIYLQARPEEQP